MNVAKRSKILHQDRQYSKEIAADIIKKSKYSRHSWDTSSDVATAISSGKTSLVIRDIDMSSAKVSTVNKDLLTQMRDRRNFSKKFNENIMGIYQRFSAILDEEGEDSSFIATKMIKLQQKEEIADRKHETMVGNVVKSGTNKLYIDYLVQQMGEENNMKSETEINEIIPPKLDIDTFDQIPFKEEEHKETIKDCIKFQNFLSEIIMETFKKIKYISTQKKTGQEKGRALASDYDKMTKRIDDYYKETKQEDNILLSKIKEYLSLQIPYIELHNNIIFGRKEILSTLEGEICIDERQEGLNQSINNWLTISHKKGISIFKDEKDLEFMSSTVISTTGQSSDANINQEERGVWEENFSLFNENES